MFTVAIVRVLFGGHSQIFNTGSMLVSSLVLPCRVKLPTVSV